MESERLYVAYMCHPAGPISWQMAGNYLQKYPPILVPAEIYMEHPTTDDRPVYG